MPAFAIVLVGVFLTVGEHDIRRPAPQPRERREHRPRQKASDRLCASGTFFFKRLTSQTGDPLLQCACHREFFFRLATPRRTTRSSACDRNPALAGSRAFTG
jgi:hypothetical protein